MHTYHDDGTLPHNSEIFVFGSNLSGIHGAGAAKIARDIFGAPYGAGMGLMGHSFAIPTKDQRVDTLPLSIISGFIDHFCWFTHVYPNSKFFVTRVGCGLAGYKDEQIAPMFKGAKNCSFAKQWKDYVEPYQEPR